MPPAKNIAPERLATLEERIAGLNRNFKVACWVAACLIIPFGTWTVKDRIDLSDRLGRIEGRLEGFVPKTVENLVKPNVPTSELEGNLSATAALFRAAQRSKIHSNPQALKAIGPTLESKLTQNRSLPAAWSAAAEYVTYVSHNDARELFQQAIKSFPPCSIQSLVPEGKPTTSSDRKSITFPPLYYEHCKIVLDGPPPPQTSRAFKECLVIYHGGEVTMTALFVDCIFEISVTGAPPPSGQEFILARLKEYSGGSG